MNDRLTFIRYAMANNMAQEAGRAAECALDVAAMHRACGRFDAAQPAYDHAAACYLAAGRMDHPVARQIEAGKLLASRHVTE